MLQEFNKRCGTVHGQRVDFRRLTQDEVHLNELHHVNDGPACPWLYLGMVNGQGPEMWTAAGRWREDGTPHELDLAIVIEK